MKTFRYILPALFLGLLIASCKKDRDFDPTDPVPQILNVAVSPSLVEEYQDSVIFEVEYHDGDGDLGENDPNAANLFIIDNRINVTETFRIRELAPSGSTIAITGTLRVVMKNTGITDNSSSQTANFTVYMRDRAGNESNRFTTEDITVYR